MTDEQTPKSKTNWTALALVLVVALAMAFMAFQIHRLSEQIAVTDRLVVDEIRQAIPEIGDTHVPCKQCRAVINANAAEVANHELSELIFKFTRAKTNHPAVNVGLEKAIHITKTRLEEIHAD